MKKRKELIEHGNGQEMEQNVQAHGYQRPTTHQAPSRIAGR